LRQDAIVLRSRRLLMKNNYSLQREMGQDGPNLFTLQDSGRNGHALTQGQGFKAQRFFAAIRLAGFSADIFCGA